MGTVHRNGTPPKKFPWKKVQVYGDWEFNEELIVKWARENLSAHMQYDFVVFQGPERFSKKTIELTTWFQSKLDAEKFQKVWMK